MQFLFSPSVTQTRQKIQIANFVKKTMLRKCTVRFIVSFHKIMVRKSNKTNKGRWAVLWFASVSTYSNYAPCIFQFDTNSAVRYMRCFENRYGWLQKYFFCI
jgi:hypothetical protein